MSLGRRMGLAAGLAALALFGAGSTLFRHPTAAPRRMVGINADPGKPAELAAIKSLGIREVRYTLYWRNYLDTRHFAADRATPVASGGLTPAEMFDADYRAGAAAGLDQLILVHSPPVGMTLQQGMTAMPAFMAARARQYPGTTWEVLNEMDGDDTYNGGWFDAKSKTVTQYQRGRSYGQLLAAVATAVHAADPRAHVISGGIALDPTDFLRGMLETCSPSLLTAVAVHAYGEPSIIQFRSKGIAARAVSRGLPVWITEFGSGLSTQALQKADLAADLNDYDVNHRYDRAYVYSLSSTEGYAIMAPNGTMRSVGTLLSGRTAP